MSNQSTSFELLHESVQKWIWSEGWTSLKDIQENSIPVVLRRDSDVIISAATAGGKTEAAFLPILSHILSNPSEGFDVLYVSPLKALINDQYRRLLDMTSETEVEVTPWHGDIDSSRKAKSVKNPSGILIITPESLESFLINRNTTVKKAFGRLKYIVIDELHAFIGNERGKQLQSLFSRIELITGNKPPRIAMSATFSNYDMVKEFLRPDGSLPCVIPSQGNSNHETRILVKEYIQLADKDVDQEIADENRQRYKKLLNKIRAERASVNNNYDSLKGRIEKCFERYTKLMVNVFKNPLKYNHYDIGYLNDAFTGELGIFRALEHYIDLLHDASKGMYNTHLNRFKTMDAAVAGIEAEINDACFRIEEKLKKLESV